MKPVVPPRQYAPFWGAIITFAPMWGNVKRNMHTIIHNDKNFFDIGQTLLPSSLRAKQHG